MKSLGRRTEAQHYTIALILDTTITVYNQHQSILVLQGCLWGDTDSIRSRSACCPTNSHGALGSYLPHIQCDEKTSSTKTSQDLSSCCTIEFICFRTTDLAFINQLVVLTLLFAREQLCSITAARLCGRSCFAASEPLQSSTISSKCLTRGSHCQIQTNLNARISRISKSISEIMSLHHPLATVFTPQNRARR